MKLKDCLKWPIKELESNINLIRLTKNNSSNFIGEKIIFRTRDNNVIRKIKNVSKSGNTIYIDHPDLGNNIGITRKIFAIKDRNIVNKKSKENNNFLLWRTVGTEKENFGKLLTNNYFYWSNDPKFSSLKIGDYLIILDKNTTTLLFVTFYGSQGLKFEIDKIKNTTLIFDNDNKEVVKAKGTNWKNFIKFKIIQNLKIINWANDFNYISTNGTLYLYKSLPNKNGINKFKPSNTVMKGKVIEKLLELEIVDEAKFAILTTISYLEKFEEFNYPKLLEVNKPKELICPEISDENSNKVSENDSLFHNLKSSISGFYKSVKKKNIKNYRIPNDIISFKKNILNEEVLVNKEIDETINPIKLSLVKNQIINKEYFNIESIISIDKPEIILDKFKSFYTKSFSILETDNEKLNELIKLVVRDNFISNTEKEFLKQKTIELDLPKNLLKKSNDYLFSNNPYLDNILSLIFMDGIIKENELDFLYEKANENEFSKSFVNNRFWEYAFHFHLKEFTKNVEFEKLIILWYVSFKTDFQLILNGDWLIQKLNIYVSNNITVIINSVLKEFELLIIDFLKKKYGLKEIKIKNIYDKVSIDENKIQTVITSSGNDVDKERVIFSDVLQELNISLEIAADFLLSKNIIVIRSPYAKIKNEAYQILKKKFNNQGVENKDCLKEEKLIINKLYTKKNIYSIFKVPIQQQKGKWNKGYCEHNNHHFIFTNIGQSGHGYEGSLSDTSFDYNNKFDVNGNLEWEAIKASKKHWESIQKLKSSSPYIFIRSPKTKENHWKFIGQGKCIQTSNESPVKFLWKTEYQEQNTYKETEKTLKVSKAINNSKKPYTFNEIELDPLFISKFKEKYEENPFDAYFSFKKQVISSYKIKNSKHIKDLWDKLINN